MSNHIEVKQTKIDILTKTYTQDISTDLTWVDTLKGIAIIGVFFDNWLGYFLHNGLIATTPALIYSFTTFLKTVVGPFVQVFFILSGFGLTLAYLEYRNTGWSWKQWFWRRATKIIFPYYIFVILSFILGIIGSRLYETVNIKFSWISLFTYLTFTRNHYPPSWVWNPPLWYMPVIVGLYVIFPILIIILKKWGHKILFLFSLLVTYISLSVAIFAGATGIHANDIFLFWTVQFTMGMILAFFRYKDPEKLRLLIGLRATIIGLAFFAFSWVLRTYVPYGKVFNDFFTSIGIFLLILNLSWGIGKFIPFFYKLLNSLSKKSYLMYLDSLPHHDVFDWTYFPECN